MRDTRSPSHQRTDRIGDSNAEPSLVPPTRKRRSQGRGGRPPPQAGAVSSLHFDFVTSRLATGGDCECLDDVLGVVEAGITHVIDNRIEWDDTSLFASHAPGVVYLHNGADDVGDLQPDWWFEDGVSFALDALAADPEAKVLAHCHMGINRGPSMAYAILLALGEDPIEAFDLVRTARPIAHMAYAQDAIEWWLRRCGAPANAIERELDRLACHERKHRLDVRAIIHRKREEEAAAFRHLRSA